MTKPPEPPPIVIQASGLTKRFGDTAVVDDVTLHIPAGTIFGLIGPSGSGKTTTVRLLTGVYAPSEGKVLVLGQPPKQFKPAMRVRLGYMPQQFVLYPGLTIWENLNFMASLYGMGPWRKRRLMQLLDFVELTEHRHKTARTISGGMQRRLALTAALIHDPEMLFLDEPTAGIDPVLRRKLWDFFKELQGRGRTLFITTQYVGEAAYCDLVGVMADGRLVFVDTPDGLRHRAYGGDVVDLHAAQTLDYRTVMALREQPFVRGNVTPLDGTGLRLVVDEAATAIPALLKWSETQTLSVASVEQYSPPLDDVFVELMKKNQAERVSQNGS